jgi:hypothetical protein
MAKRPRHSLALAPWLAVGMQAWALGAEASAVIALRALKLAAGGAQAEREARRMVTEKMDTALDVQQAALSGALGVSPATVAKQAVRRYRRKVRANRRRLSR